VSTHTRDIVGHSRTICAHCADLSSIYAQPRRRKAQERIILLIATGISSLPSPRTRK